MLKDHGLGSEAATLKAVVIAVAYTFERLKRKLVIALAGVNFGSLEQDVAGISVEVGGFLEHLQRIVVDMQIDEHAALQQMEFSGKCVLFQTLIGNFERFVAEVAVAVVLDDGEVGGEFESGRRAAGREPLKLAGEFAGARLDWGTSWAHGGFRHLFEDECIRTFCRSYGLYRLRLRRLRKRSRLDQRGTDAGGNLALGHLTGLHHVRAIYQALP